jgi:hypothetical protein
MASCSSKNHLTILKRARHISLAAWDRRQGMSHREHCQASCWVLVKCHILQSCHQVLLAKAEGGTYRLLSAEEIPPLQKEQFSIHHKVTRDEVGRPGCHPCVAQHCNTWAPEHIAVK